jgi:hypothetical protein
MPLIRLSVADLGRGASLFTIWIASTWLRANDVNGAVVVFATTTSFSVLPTPCLPRPTSSSTGQATQTSIRTTSRLLPATDTTTPGRLSTGSSPIDDLTALNLECAPSDLGDPEPKEFVFRCRIESQGSLAPARIEVSIDWGVELDTGSRPEDIERAEAMIDAGADAIFGHHAYRLQPIEMVIDAALLWGLGNFVWQRHSKAGRRP